MLQEPRYFQELSRHVEAHLGEAQSVLLALAALLTDPDAYVGTKGQPTGPLAEWVQQLMLADNSLQPHLMDPTQPVSRLLIDGKWCAVWRNARSSSNSVKSHEYDVCISFAGSDRAIAERIATSLTANGMNRKVFYDQFEQTSLWGEDLFTHLHKIYSERSKFCIILFSHAYRERAWTRHELRAAQTRTLVERGSYVLPVALEEGAVPDEFSSVGYWPFSPGSEDRIAEAAEAKINQYLERNYFSAEELADLFTRDAIAGALLDGYRKGISEHTAAGDPAGADVLKVLALVAAADVTNLRESTRALVYLVLFSPGAVGDRFESDSLRVFGDARIRRWMGADGPLIMSNEGWSDHLQPYRERMESLRDRQDPDDEDSN